VPLPPVIDKVPDYTGCVDDNDRALKCAKHALNKKTKADIVTMIAAFPDVFLNASSSKVRASFQQHCLRKLNFVFVDMFEWFVGHYGKTTAKDCDANRLHMAANWHPPNGFDTLILLLFTGAVYASCTVYTMADRRDIVDISLRVIKQCGMYAEEFKAWIACKTERPRIVKTFHMFKTFWATTLVNQTAVPASMHGYGMAAVNNDNSIVSYGESTVNFGAAYAATHKSVKAHSLMITLMQGQLQAMQQFCMALQQQQHPPPTYAPQQQQPGRHGLSSRNTPGGAGRGYLAVAYQQPTMVECHLQPSTPFKRFENWNYCNTHSGDTHNTHTSGTCRHPAGPSHNPSATRANTMGGSTAGLHKTFLPSAAGHAPPPPRQQRAPTTATWQQHPPPMNITSLMAVMRPMMPMMPPVPYQALYHVSQQFGPNPPFTPPPTTPVPQQGTMMMPYYAQYQQPPPF
jgi:hypothetical protein